MHLSEGNGYGNTGVDKTPNGNDGTLQGGVEWVESTAPIYYWLSITPSSGIVAASSAMDINVLFDATGLVDGGYMADILITSNDPDEGQVAVPVTWSVILGVEAEQALPQSFALHQNYPNPFNPTATIRFDLPQSAQVSLVVYDLLGRRVAELVSQEIEPGYHSVTWNAGGITGRNLASGIYIARLQATPTAGVAPEYSKFSTIQLLK